ncbi:MAG: hypothetical protein LBQ80_04790 [Clostridium sp.]|nr:hypothetical protein [Clostridium sp.]
MLKNLLAGLNAGKRRLIKPLILLVCAVYCLTMLLGGTFAWFSFSDEKTETIFTPGPAASINIGLVDVFPPGETKPGESRVKRVGAQNMTNTAVFVRLLVLPCIVADDGTLLPAEIGEQLLLDDLNTADWYDGGDGYYYYRHVLKSGESTDSAKNLFNSVSVAASLPDAYKGARLTIDVRCDSVEARKYAYRVAWWQDSNTDEQSAQSDKLAAIDAELAALAK